jgi:predicted enzyme related to lactoylglutathione lyase
MGEFFLCARTSLPTHESNEKRQMRFNSRCSQRKPTANVLSCRYDGCSDGARDRPPPFLISGHDFGANSDGRMKMNPVVHFEMPYEDCERLVEFYTQAFGWQMQKLGEDMGNYVTAATTETDENMMVKRPGAINGGFFPKKADWPAQYPSVVIEVDDIKEARKKVAEAGGTVLGDPMEIPGIGQYVSFTDTEGNRVGILQPVKR